MIRFFVPSCFVSCVVALVICASAAAQSPAAQPPGAEPKPVASPVCIYNSKDYSEGAYVCAPKSLMLKCSVDGAKATWTAVTDKEWTDRCPAAPKLSAAQRRALWNRRNIAREITPPG
ncbi:MAG TPA: DUF1496 domain-containing protein [Afipia sp.]